MSDHDHIPGFHAQDIPDVVLDVSVRSVVCRKQIAAPGVEASLSESLTHGTGCFTTDEYSDVFFGYHDMSP
jgi:hypothetical protein